MPSEHTPKEQERLALTKQGWYQFFCGHPTCPSRLAGKLHDVHEKDMDDGVVWLCQTCRDAVS